MRSNILATENQQVKIYDVINVKIGVYSHKGLNKVKRGRGHPEVDCGWELPFISFTWSLTEKHIQF